MHVLINNCLSELEFGELQQFKNIGVIPLFLSINHGPMYLTLKEALDKRLITITEISHGGSVPELKVINEANIPVLLLDGEELVGAKQNRVLNTTILLREDSVTIIPVSCTEQGRWSYVSDEFEDSDVVVPYCLRTGKMRSVTESLDRSSRYDSDQGAVWRQIRELSMKAKVSPRTGALRDVYKSKISDLNEYLKTFDCLPSQKGLLVFIDGEVAGFDYVSSESAYQILHPKLVKSYAMDALLQASRSRRKPSVKKAKAFIEEAMRCSEKRYKSVGYGWDYRLESREVVGSALVHQKNVIHMAFFRASETERAGDTPGMSGFRRRRGFRAQPGGSDYNGGFNGSGGFSNGVVI
ncbi:MAG: hypothetical protein QME63_06850 [Actinomycetota bacterium]|nr:hypothetical protein [Actinomycetota bacterium]